MHKQYLLQMYKIWFISSCHFFRAHGNRHIVSNNIQKIAERKGDSQVIALIITALRVLTAKSNL